MKTNINTNNETNININTKRYCKFNQTMLDEETIIFKENQEYLITYETEDMYYFGDNIIQEHISAISKDEETKSYEIVEREEWI